MTMSSACREEIFISSISHWENSLVYIIKVGLGQKRSPHLQENPNLLFLLPSMATIS